MLDDKSCELCSDMTATISIPNQRVAWISDEWAVFATLGPLSDHHIMLVPKIHRNYSLEIPDGAKFISNAMTLWSNFVGQRAWLAFEHANSANGCGVVHAHVHLFASNTQISIETLFPDLEMSKLQSLGEICDSKEELLWCTDSTSEIYAAVGKKIKSQYARSRISDLNQLEFPSDWKKYTHPEWLQANISLAQKFAHHMRR